MLLINDTNIWIDLKSISLIEEVFLLPYDIGVPNILYYDELKDTDGEILEANGIRIIEMTDEEVIDTINKSGQTKRVSFNDLTTLVVAQSRGYILVTGDGNLRMMAQKEKVELRGTIWIIDELVDKDIISKESAVIACNKLINLGRRLPQNELLKRIRLWSDEAAVGIDN